MSNFWQKLNKPILALAPMAGIADSAFRHLCKEYGADVLYSEMASVTALFYNPKETLELIEFDVKERPYIVQLFGSNPEHFVHAARLLSDKNYFKKFTFNFKLSTLNFKAPDGLDINFGCPVPKVAKQGAGAELMKDLKLSREVIKSVVDNSNLPVSIKIRAKAGEIDALKFLDNISDLNVKAVMIHGRTLSQGFNGPIDTEIIKKARDHFKGIILANGGINNYEDAERVLKESEADGLGIARGALGKPWMFKELKVKCYPPPLKLRRTRKLKVKEEIFRVALKHARLVEKLKGKQGVIEMRKHLCWYVQGLSGARKMREELVKIENIHEIEEIFNKNS